MQAAAGAWGCIVPIILIQSALGTYTAIVDRASRAHARPTSYASTYTCQRYCVRKRRPTRAIPTTRNPSFHHSRMQPACLRLIHPGACAANTRTLTSKHGQCLKGSQLLAPESYLATDAN